MVLNDTLTIGELTAFVLYLDRLLRPDPAARPALHDLPVRARPPSSRSASCWSLEPSRSPSAPTPIDLPPIDGRIELRRRRRSPTTPGTRCCTTSTLAVAAGRDVGPGRRDRRGQVHHRQARRPLLRPDRRATCASTATTSATSRWRRCGASSAWCRRSRSCSSAASATTPTFARPEATDAEVLDACRAVGLDDLLDRLPDGIDIVGPRARHLVVVRRAAAPRPRPGLPRPAARARARRGHVHLDLKSESQIERALDVVLDGRTAILIAHRLATAMRADRIAVVRRRRHRRARAPTTSCWPSAARYGVHVRDVAEPHAGRRPHRAARRCPLIAPPVGEWAECAGAGSHRPTGPGHASHRA